LAAGQATSGGFFLRAAVFHVELLLLLGAIVLLAGIGRGGRGPFKVPKSERGKRYLANRLQKKGPQREPGA
jgi:hypothetical protein